MAVDVGVGALPLKQCLEVTHGRLIALASALEGVGAIYNKTSHVSPLAAVAVTIQAYAKVEVDTGLQFKLVDGGSNMANV